MRALAIILAIIFVSCGAKKIKVDKLETKKDSTAQTEVVTSTIVKNDKADSTSVTTNTIIEELTIVPFDSTKTIYVNNIPYKNAILNLKKAEIKSSYNNKNKELNIAVKDSLNKKTTQASEIVIDDNTVSEDKDKGLSYFWIILILIIIIIWLSRR
jgi:hypothetical protein